VQQDIVTRVIDVLLQFPEKVFNVCPAEREHSALMFAVYPVRFLNKISSILVASVMVSLDIPKRIRSIPLISRFRMHHK
jgi:hypothetical protein